MAEPESALEQIDDEADPHATAKAEAEIDAGKGVPHAQVREWLLKLAKGEVVPPPCK